jgi:hypothetical protein
LGVNKKDVRNPGIVESEVSRLRIYLEMNNDWSMPLRWLFAPLREIFSASNRLPRLKRIGTKEICRIDQKLTIVFTSSPVKVA